MNKATGKGFRKRGIAITSEHGSWGMLFEPLVAAVAVAPSAGTIWILLLVIGAFMARQPLKILLKNVLAGRDLPQNSVAMKFTLMYAAVFISGAAGSLLTVPVGALIPFVVVAPLAVYQVKNDVFGKSRELIPELTGSLAISSSAAVIALNAGWTIPAAVALWSVLAARSVTSVFYVRNRLRLEKGKKYRVFPVIAVHSAAIAMIGCLAFYGLASWFTVAVFSVLLMRGSFGLSRFRRSSKAVKIGIWEVIYGLLTVASIIAGHYIGV